MDFLPRVPSPVGQSFGSDSSEQAFFASGAFVQCPTALTAGMSAEQLEQIAALYQKALAQAREQINARKRLLSRRMFPSEGGFGPYSRN